MVCKGLAIAGSTQKTPIRDNGIVEVTGSIPVGSTNQSEGLAGSG
jgi:hypothetical protein